MVISSDRFSANFTRLPCQLYPELFDGFQKTGISGVMIIEYPAFGRNALFVETPKGIINDNPTPRHFPINTIFICKEDAL